LRNSKADALSVVPSSERIKELWVICRQWSQYAIGGNMAKKTTRISEKRLLISWGFRVPTSKKNFALNFIAFRIALMKGKVADHHVLARMMRKIEVASD